MFSGLWYTGKILVIILGESLDPMHAVLLTWSVDFVIRRTETLSSVANHRLNRRSDNSA